MILYIKSSNVNMKEYIMVNLKYLSLTICLLLLASIASAETLTLTTYYPAPFGAYDRIRLVPRADDIDCSTANAGGTIFVTSDTNPPTLRFCDGIDANSSTIGAWRQILDTSTNPDSLDLYPSSERVNAPLLEARMGLGLDYTSEDPEFKLHMEGNGGILATGAFGSGDTLSTAGAGARMIWYPRKGAFRAGVVDDFVAAAIPGDGGVITTEANRWNDANIANFSVAFGRTTQASGLYSTVAGGLMNAATTNQATVGGGMYNRATGQSSTVAGGGCTNPTPYNAGNWASGVSSFIGGGCSNVASDLFSGVGAGSNNNARNDLSMIAGGSNNNAYGFVSFIGGGSGNRTGTVVDPPPVTNGRFSTITGGLNNVASADNSFVGGGLGNRALGNNAVVSGGSGNRASGITSTVAGGGSNTASNTASFIGGGGNNTVSANYGAIAGGNNNNVLGLGVRGFIGGGQNNNVDGDDTVVVGGNGNNVTGTEGGIVSGNNNNVGGNSGFVGAGNNNAANSTNAAVVAGASNTASGQNAFVGAGSGNTASQTGAVVVGGTDNTASGSNSFAGGNGMTVSGTNAFGWGVNDTVAQNNAFVVMDGNVGIDVAAPAERLHVNGDSWFQGNMTIGTPGNPLEELTVLGNITANAFIYSSDKRLKKDVSVIDDPVGKISMLKGVQFRWINNDKKSLGLIAQDVEKVFPELVETNEKTGMKAVEYGNLVAPLIEAVKAQQKMIEEQAKEIELLKQRLEHMESDVQKD